MRYDMMGTVGQWTFYEVTNHGFTGELTDRPLYGFAVGNAETLKGSPKLGELYASLEYAMVAAVGERFTGPRGAGGTGVAPAADWFMKMIGASQQTRAELIATVAKTDTVKTAATHHLCAPEVHAEAMVDALDLSRKIWDGRKFVVDPAEY
jgi:hypothetical protein